MLTKIFNSFGTTLYVQIWKNRIKVTDINTRKVFDEVPLLAIDKSDEKKHIVVAIGNSAKSKTSDSINVVNPFDHPRSLLSDFTVAEKILQHIFRELLNKKLLSPAPLVIIQPMEMLEGGLTMIESRAFRELAYSAGARDAFPYTGKELTAKEIVSKEFLSYEGLNINA